MSENFNPAACHQVNITGHGGGCCGISHINNFTNIGSRLPNYLQDADDAEKRVRYLMGKYWADTQRVMSKEKHRLYEAVLKESQRKQWEPILERIGFKLVQDWLNTNSGNRCYMYVLAIGPKNSGGAYKSPYAAPKKSKVPNPFAPQIDSSVRY